VSYGADHDARSDIRHRCFAHPVDAAAVSDRDYNFGQAASSVRKLATNAIGWSIIT
jgi:hypothetical protein